MPPETAPTEARAEHLQRGLSLEMVTVGWNVVEAGIALVAGFLAGSVALVGFGLDAVVEAPSGSILFWRLRTEQTSDDPARVRAVEHRAQRLVAFTLFALAGYVAVDAGWTLWTMDEPSPSTVGIVLAVLSLGVMWWWPAGRICGSLAALRRSKARSRDEGLPSGEFESTATKPGSMEVWRPRDLGRLRAASLGEAPE